MTRRRSIALITTLCFAFTARAGDKPSPAVKRVLDKAVAGVKKNHQDFEKANEMPLSDAKAELQELAKALIQAGKEDEATAVLAQLKTLDADVMRMAISSTTSKAKSQLEERAKRLIEEGKTDEATAVLAQIKVIETEPASALFGRLAGKWTHASFGNTFIFQPDGAFQEVDKPYGRIVCSGKLGVLSDDFVEAKASNGYRFRVGLVASDTLAMLVWNPSGSPDRGLVLERIK